MIRELRKELCALEMPEMLVDRRNGRLAAHRRISGSAEGKGWGEGNPTPWCGDESSLSSLTGEGTPRAPRQIPVLPHLLVLTALVLAAIYFTTPTPFPGDPQDTRNYYAEKQLRDGVGNIPMTASEKQVLRAMAKRSNITPPPTDD